MGVAYRKNTSSTLDPSLRLGNSTDQQILISAKKNSQDFIQHKALPTDIDFRLEELLTETFKDTHKVIGLGREDDVWEFGTLVVDDEKWQDVIKNLADRASAIFIVPSSHEGTYWEMEHIVSNNLLEKTVFFMPPLSDPKSLFERKFWEEAVNSATTLGLELPKYDFSGCLITFSSDKKIKDKGYLLKNIDHTRAIFRKAVHSAKQLEI